MGNLFQFSAIFTQKLAKRTVKYFSIPSVFQSQQCVKLHYGYFHKAIICHGFLHAHIRRMNAPKCYLLMSFPKFILQVKNTRHSLIILRANSYRPPIRHWRKKVALFNKNKAEFSILAKVLIFPDPKFTWEKDLH